MNPWQKIFTNEEAMEICNDLIKQNQYINNYIESHNNDRAEVPLQIRNISRVIDEQLAELENEIIRRYLLKNFSPEIKKELFNMTAEIKSVRELLKAL